MKEKGLRRSKVRKSTLRHPYYLLHSEIDAVVTTKNTFYYTFFLSLSITYNKLKM